MFAKKILPFLVAMVALFGFASPAFASYVDSSENLAQLPYYIQAYDIKVDVSEDNVLHVTENIDVIFNEPRHGIYRYIPVKNHVQRANGTYTMVKTRVRNVDCNESYSSSTYNENFVMQIGDEYVTITGPMHYTISYDYQVGKDAFDGADELYFNLIGDGWDTVIQNVTFEINMPKEFDSNLLGFSSGSYGNEGSESVEYFVNGLQIGGKLTTSLAPHEALTVRLELEDGYFYFNQTAQNAKLLLLIILPAICLIGVAIIWKKYGDDKKVVQTVEFYPPENMSCIDVAYWNKGVLTNNDVVPLLIELANEGYISIEDDIYGEYVINFVKQYDGADESKRIFFNGLFDSGNKRITQKYLERTFYATINEITKKYNTSHNIKKVFVGKSLLMRCVCVAMCIVCLFVNLYLFSNAYGEEQKYVPMLIGSVLLILAFVLSFFVRCRTDKGHQLLGRIKGFKQFLETAEKDKLETLVHDNPSYYYDILPYAYVLGVSGEWTNKFAGIALEPPRWYVGSNRANQFMLYRMINKTISNCSSAMTSTPHTSGSFGGGGFSGGGIGGGGGGSW